MLYSPALDPSRPHLNVAVVGQSGSGKTLLGLAVQRRCEQVRPLGRSKVGFRDVDLRTWFVAPGGQAILGRIVTSEFASPYRHYNSLDFAGHRREIKAAAVAIAAADAVLVVVDATQGPMAQTREHALLAHIFGKRDVLVFINGCDRAKDAEQIDVCEIETREVLASVGFDGDAIPFFRGSASNAMQDDPQWVAAIDELIVALDRDCADPPREASKIAEAQILHRYERPGVACLAEIVVRRGVVRFPMRLRLLGSRSGEQAVTVVGMRVFNEDVTELGAGDVGTVALQLNATPRDRRRYVRRGFLLVSGSKALLPMSEIEATLSLIKAEEGGRHTGLRPGAQAILNFAGLRSVGRILPIASQEPIVPGQREVRVKITLQNLVPCEVGDSFAVSDGSDGFQRQFGGQYRWGGTIGHGKVTALIQGTPDSPPDDD